MKMIKGAMIDLMLVAYDISQQVPEMFMRILSTAALVLFALGIVIVAVRIENSLLLFIGVVCAVVWGIALVITAIIAHRRSRSQW